MRRVPCGGQCTATARERCTGKTAAGRPAAEPRRFRRGRRLKAQPPPRRAQQTPREPWPRLTLLFVAAHQRPPSSACVTLAPFWGPWRAGTRPASSGKAAGGDPGSLAAASGVSDQTPVGFRTGTLRRAMGHVPCDRQRTATPMQRCTEKPAAESRRFHRGRPPTAQLAAPAQKQRSGQCNRKSGRVLPYRTSRQHGRWRDRRRGGRPRARPAPSSGHGLRGVRARGGPVHGHARRPEAALRLPWNMVAQDERS